MKQHELESRLYSILDTMRSRFRETFDYWGDDKGGGVYLRTFGPGIAFDQNDPDGSFKVETTMAEIEGVFEGERLRACLNVIREARHLEDILDVRWEIANSNILAAWLRSMETRLDEFRPPQVLPISDWYRVRHCWPTQRPVDLLFAAGPRTTRQTALFGRWVNQEIAPEVIRLLGGWHEHPDGDVFCFFRLTSACTHSQWVTGTASGRPHSTLMVDAVSVVILNWIVTVGLRLNDVSIHAYVDDEGVGQEPLAPELREELAVTGRMLHGWLIDRWGDRTATLLSRLAWATSGVGFSEGIDGGFGNQKPTRPCHSQPPINEFWQTAIRQG